MLSKQSIRREHTIYLNEVKMTKEEIIEISKDFSENEELRFRKMLKQGGKFSIKGRKFIITAPDKLYNSKGEEEVSTYTNNEE